VSQSGVATVHQRSWFPPECTQHTEAQ
jgi:hypothetical protein